MYCEVRENKATTVNCVNAKASILKQFFSLLRSFVRLHSRGSAMVSGVYIQYTHTSWELHSFIDKNMNQKKRGRNKNTVQRALNTGEIYIKIWCEWYRLCLHYYYHGPLYGHTNFYWLLLLTSHDAIFFLFFSFFWYNNILCWITLGI